MSNSRCTIRSEDKSLYCTLNNKLYRGSKYTQKIFNEKYDNTEYKYYYADVSSVSEKNINIKNMEKITELTKPENIKDNSDIYVINPQNKLILILGGGTLEENNKWNDVIKKLYPDNPYEIYFLNQKEFNYQNILSEPFNANPLVKVVPEIFLKEKYNRYFDHILFDHDYKDNWKNGDKTLAYLFQGILGSNGIVDLPIWIKEKDIKKEDYTYNEKDIKLKSSYGKLNYDNTLFSYKNLVIPLNFNEWKEEEKKEYLKEYKKVVKYSLIQKTIWTLEYLYNSNEIIYEGEKFLSQRQGNKYYDNIEVKEIKDYPWPHNNKLKNKSPFDIVVFIRIKVGKSLNYN